MGKIAAVRDDSTANPALGPNLDQPNNPSHEFGQFGTGCFLGVELAVRRVVGVVKTEVEYSQGHVPDPNYSLVLSGSIIHVEVVQSKFDSQVCPYTNLLSVFRGRHDPTTLNRQIGDVERRYRSGIYYYSENRARLAQASMEVNQLEVKDKKIVAEILPAKRFYRAVPSALSGKRRW